jgi:CheY-like chemotaxis protein
MESDSPAPLPAQKVSIDQILQAGWYLLALINEVLDLSLIESGRLSLSSEKMSLAEVLSDCRAMMEPLAQKRGIAMTFPTFDVPHYVMADRTRVRQILVNLLSNAIKYNRQNGTVVVTCALRASGYVRVSVTDTGLGLTSEKLEQLFQPFNRLGQEAGSEQGTGIGLVMTKRLVEVMKGAIGVDSTVGAGTMFWIDLVATTAPRHDFTQIDKSNQSRDKATFNGRVRTILYVEDNPANLKLVTMLVARRADLRLLTAENGNLGVELAQAHLPDLILMDINLPGISGFKVMSILSKDSATSHIPIIALSANANPRDIEKGLKAGFLKYLTKPIKVDELMETLDLGLALADVNRPAAPKVA